MRAGIGLGSNLNDRQRMLETAIDALHRISVRPEADKVSSFYETHPVDCLPGTPDFVNAVMEIETELVPLELLIQLQALETASGRARVREKNQPRSLDLDLLYVDNLTLSTPELILPHPVIAQRPFVLIPLMEVSPDRILPGYSVSVSEIFEQIYFENSESVKKL